jgi:hypothetical protein
MGVGCGDPRCRGAEVQRCRGAEVQRCGGRGCRGAGVRGAGVRGRKEVLMMLLKILYSLFSILSSLFSLLSSPGCRGVFNKQLSNKQQIINNK